MPEREPMVAVTPGAAATAAPLVLIIDDNQYDIDLVHIAFAENGFAARFITAKDGEEASRLVRRMAGDPARALPDLILLDLNLPRLNGVGVLALIRAEAAFAQVPVVVLTTSEFPADRTRCLALGAAAFVIKSHRLHDFFASIKGLAPYVTRAPQGGGEARPASDGPGGGGRAEIGDGPG
jgi:CheY-like chemotaxis protein